MPVLKISYWILALFFGGAIYSYLFGSSNGDTINLANSMFYTLSPLLAVLGGIYAISAFGLKTRRGRTVLLITIGLLSWFVGESLWSYYEFILGIDPFPSLADVAYLIGYPLLAVGIYSEIANHDSDSINLSKWNKLLTGLLIVTAAGLVAYFGIFVAYDADASMLNNTVAIAYGIGDLILVGLVLLALKVVKGYQGGRLYIPWLLFLIAITLTLIADLIFAANQEAYEAGHFWLRQIDLIWILSYIFFAAGFFQFGGYLKAIQDRISKKK